ncbi:MAG: hypothetical protein GJ676_20050 [Rhodobacteraceae bacterium]|nr:hypothetical protein [Paracoccaceae bacterium]
MTIETLTTVFGWMTVLNFAMLAFMTVMVLALRDWATGLHARMFDMEPAAVHRSYFNYLALYKALTLIFCLMPYLALKLT